MHTQHTTGFRFISLSKLAAIAVLSSVLIGCNSSGKQQALTTTTYDITDLSIVPKWDVLDSNNYQEFEPMNRAREIQTTVDALIKPIPAPIEDPTAAQVHEGQVPTPPPSSLTLDKGAALTVTASPDAHKLVLRFLEEARLNKVQTITQVKAWIVTLPTDKSPEVLVQIADMEDQKVAGNRGYYLFSDKQRQSLFDQASSRRYMGRLKLLNPGSGFLEDHGQQIKNTLTITSVFKETQTQARELKHEWMNLDYNSTTLYVTLKAAGFEELSQAFSLTSETSAVLRMTPITGEIQPTAATWLVLGVEIDRPSLPHPMP